ncbi:hypothetical protein R69658_05386 [Paraburkholderia aspalathi]|uniref:Uncharacterized protein n=1 Tax=Paraburkholderia aspalathi TaxID=1324617 RepID=A0ABM8SHP9_9BURK|nr:hypothetical protein [Paraburkholderia aspalathi]MBK3821763.1 hypothetical protein [Paraburkholderia aspalathi]MBK3833633.1 hypothetical protein [Paraburkholderia aspalathi]MBK3863356.1 hypothetical protein [Paraburkholderia aspalathi]CAE6810682.1 hypothetical protein R69658_05386 [Paraburkholderia aspalathi]
MPADAAAVRTWFEQHAGAGYDWAGVFGFVVRPLGGEPDRYFCSGSIATAPGVKEPFRLDPNAFEGFAASVAQYDRAFVE